MLLSMMHSERTAHLSRFALCSSCCRFMHRRASNAIKGDGIEKGLEWLADKLRAKK